MRKGSSDTESLNRLIMTHINCLYKLSKCRRVDNSELQLSLEQQTTAKAHRHCFYTSVAKYERVSRKGELQEGVRATGQQAQDRVRSYAIDRTEQT